MADFRLGVALLAAGASRRFGTSDKLAADLNGRRLGEHAAAALPVERCAQSWVIVSSLAHPCEAFWKARGLVPVLNPDADDGMGTSVALAARLASAAGCDALLIALADMPCVPPAHFGALIHAFEEGAQIAVSAAGDTRMPPAIFGAGLFESLAVNHGDQGARTLIQTGQSVPCPPDWLVDVDTPKALSALQEK
ncbi:MAG: nucleotidyltransferase family protein [Erythrobacter sp.]